MDIKTACALTGHRNLEENFDNSLLKEVLAALIADGYANFLCGMAVGFDLLAAETVLEFKKNGVNIKLIACVPCEGQSRYYPEEEKARYTEILSSCDEVKILSDRYYKGCMQARDRYMVDNSSALIAYKLVNKGGTYYTLKYALSENKNIFIV